MIDELKDRMLRGGWPLRTVARLAGVAPSTVLEIRRGRGNPLAKTALAVECALDALEDRVDQVDGVAGKAEVGCDDALGFRRGEGAPAVGVDHPQDAVAP